MSDWCKGRKAKIDDVPFCIGQLYVKNLKREEIAAFLAENKICIINADGTIYMDRNNYDEELFYSFFDLTLDISQIGWSKSQNTIYGEKIIRLLYKDFVNK